MASEVGVADSIKPGIIRKGRLQPGRMFLVDTSQGRIVGDDEIKHDLVNAEPYGDWLADGLAHLEDLPPRFRPDASAFLSDTAPAHLRLHHRRTANPG